MQLSWRAEAVQLAVIAGMFVLAAAVWSRVPERIPIHWNLQGEADGFGGRAMGLLLLPAIALGLYLLLRFLPLVDPGRANYARFAGAYLAMRGALVLFLAGIYIATVLAALGYRLNMSTIVAPLAGALLIVMGLLMPRIEPNWFVGVRTPWTLSSKLSWEKTHRASVWLFVPLGLLIAACGIVQAGWLLFATIAFGVVGVVWLFVYSYVVYRADPNSVTPGGK